MSNLSPKLFQDTLYRIMNPPYVLERNRLVDEINAKKAVYQFRAFLYSLDRNARRNTFEICRTYLENELQDQSIHMTEREWIQAALNHFDWETFVNHSMNWWNTLSMNHTRCRTLVSLIQTWIYGLAVLDTRNISDDASLGLR